MKPQAVDASCRAIAHLHTPQSCARAATLQPPDSKTAHRMRSASGEGSMAKASSCLLPGTLRLACWPAAATKPSASCNNGQFREAAL